jgi:hypothetical protein
MLIGEFRKKPEKISEENPKLLEFPVLSRPTKFPK